MRLIINSGKRWPGYPLWAVALVGGWLLMVGLLTLYRMQTGYEATLCLFKRATGHPCPTCGLTRGVVALSEGRLLAALSMNPLMMVVLLTMSVLLLVRLVSGYEVRLEPGNRLRRVLWPLLGALAAINWVYLFWHHV